MDNGKFLIISTSSGRMIGAFEVIDETLHNLYGIASELLAPGPLNTKNKLKLAKINNGYMHIEPVADEQNLKNEINKIELPILVIHIGDQRQVFDLTKEKDQYRVWKRFNTFNPKAITKKLGSEGWAKSYNTTVDMKKAENNLEYHKQQKHVEQWAKENGHHSPKFLLNLLRGV
jgi:hypothetical protein